MTLPIRMTLAIVTLVAATTVGVLFFTNKALENIICTRALVQIETHARLLANKLKDKIDDIKDDVLFLIPSSSLEEFILLQIRGAQNLTDGTTQLLLQERITTFIIAKISTNRSYLKLNIIGIADGGREILRVDRTGPERSHRIAPRDELRRLGDEDFFKTVIKLKQGQVYVSPIQINNDPDVVTEVASAAPVMLVATPIFAPDGSTYGAIAITADARQILDSVRSISIAGNYADGDQIYVVNGRGDYLIKPDHARDFGSTVEPANGAVEEWPELATILGTDHSKTLMLSDRTGESFGVAIASIRPVTGAWFGVIVTVPHAAITAPVVAIHKASILTGLVGILVSIVLATLLAKSIAKPLVQMAREIDAFKSGAPILMPEKALSASGEVGILARAFEHMAEEIANKSDVLRRESEQREKLKDDFVAMVSHELRTPLTSIAASLGLLVADPAETLSDAAKRLLRIAHRNSQRLVRLINDILDMEKIKSGKIEFHMSKIDVWPLLEQVIESNRGLADQFEVALRLDPESIDARVYADVDRLTQVITNLLSNAVKFSPRGSEVLVTIASIGPSVRIAVRDHGPGIPEEFKARIFEKFAQAEPSDPRQKGGTGLGLNIVKQIVDRLGGQTGFDVAPGGGTIFYVDLPCYDTKAMVVLNRAEGAQILLCADEPVAAALLCDQFHQAGFHVDVAFTSEEAIRGTASRSYAAILVDLQLPDSDAIALIKKLRSQWHYQNTPVIAVSTDLKHLQGDEHGLMFNALDWLSKPLDIERLVRILNRPIIRDEHSRPRILHFDGDGEVLRLAADALKASADVFSADTIEQARRALADRVFDHAAVEVNLAGGDFGIDLLPDLRDKNGYPIPTIIYSAQDSPEIAASVIAALAKSPTSIQFLVATLCRYVAGRPMHAPQIKEVA